MNNLNLSYDPNMNKEPKGRQQLNHSFIDSQRPLSRNCEKYSDDPPPDIREPINIVQTEKQLLDKESIAEERNNISDICGSMQKLNIGQRSFNNTEIKMKSPPDDSFVKAQFQAFSIKRTLTPKLELPQITAVDKKLIEIGDIVDMNELDKFETLVKSAHKLPLCYAFRSSFISFRHTVSLHCQEIISHPVFETITILVILVNCITLAMDDPTTDAQDSWQTVTDYIFQSLYTLELLLKVFGMGFVTNHGSYLRDPWNVLDFIIVIFGFLGYFQVSGGIDLKELRSFRVMRPLRTITAIEGLKILMSALVSSLPLLMDTIVVLLFCYMIFAIAGLQLWHGVLQKRCLNVVTGDVDDSKICGYRDCPDNFICVTYLSNPNYGATSFDNIFVALLTVYQCVTLEGWTDILFAVDQAFGPYAVVYFFLLIFIGAFFLVNFTLAVIKSRVTTVYQENREAKMKKLRDRKKRKRAASVVAESEKNESPKTNPEKILMANMVQFGAGNKTDKEKEEELLGSNADVSLVFGSGRKKFEA